MANDNPAELKKTINNLNQKIESLNKELEIAKGKAEDAETKQVELENSLKIALDSSKEVTDKFNKATENWKLDFEEMEQRLNNAKASKALAMGMDPTQLAMLTVMALPACKDANGNYFSKNIEENAEQVAKGLKGALKVVRKLLDMIAQIEEDR